jgi:hypothetical protein
MWQVVPISAELVVEGRDDARAGGPFRGRVLALALDTTADAELTDVAVTWLLVADDARPAPIWVTTDAIAAQRLGR